MKSKIHEIQKNKLQSLSKKLLMVLAVALGTTAMVSAQTTPAQTAPAKEVKATKKATKKAAKKAEPSKSATTAEAAVPKK
ncbi:hypothetical protein [Flavobacterium taihuense]|uniref:Uncharacterized protein n=1 Tax=Flavobacterium taihuense TaxID=2857508 RepID=A0ABS6XS57_9FLAO|nr:hypothetical protein [Flavobacterium taihuense]MBW4359516.1 hypothetical protein [Flavobacterium taihuense]